MVRDHLEKPEWVQDFVDKAKARRQESLERFNALDMDECQLCLRSHCEMRSLTIDAFCDLQEIIPEMIDLYLCPPPMRGRGFFLRLCIHCRAELLEHLKQWRDEALRSQTACLCD